MKRKLKQYEIYKISVERLVEHKGNKINVVPLTLTKREALERYEIVKIQSNQLTNKIFDYFAENNIRHYGLDLSNVIVNVYVPMESKKKGEKEYSVVAKRGFTLNGKKFVRLMSGSGQIRRNTITFIREDLYKPIFESLLCGLTLDDFGKDFNAAKYNAYFGLNMSGCHLLPDSLSPNVCIIDDYEQIRPHEIVNHVTEKEVEYITLPDEDLVISDDIDKFIVSDGVAVRKSDGAEFTIRKGIKKYVKSEYYDEIEDSPCLNSFDGQGIASPEWMERVSNYLGLDYIPSAVIVRCPWVKGLLVNVPLTEWMYKNGITEVTDSFGKVRRIEDIDCFISKSQFKMHKIYKKKCDKLGVNAWDYHQTKMLENNLLWGITKVAPAVDDDIKALNYQYLQALQLENEDIDKLCEQTEDFLQSLCCGDLEVVYNSLLVNGKNFIEDEFEDDDIPRKTDFKKLYQQAIEANPAMINDKYIRSCIVKECEVKFNQTKLGKILVDGNFQFIISDPIAQLEWIAKNHGGADVDVVGVVPSGMTYSNYWLNKQADEIVLMRSPLIDRNEIAKRKLVKETNHYFRYLSSGLVYPINDLTALQQGGCDMDGDIAFSTNNEIVRKGSMKYGEAKPLYYKLSTTDLVGRISSINMIKADVRGLNSAVGKISNVAGSLYALLENYSADGKEYNCIYNSIVALGQIVGMEIDRIKTAVAPTKPCDWKPLQIKRFQDADGNVICASCDDERNGINRHNALVPDIKPYYFRYNYDYIDKAIKDSDSAFNRLSDFNLGIKLSELIKRVENGTANAEESEIYSQYKRDYPVIDTDCIVNHVCHHFEDFEKSVKRESRSEGVNMLKDYISDNNLDAEMLQATATIIDEYKRYRKFVGKSMSANLKENKKNKSKKASETQQTAGLYYCDKLLDIAKGDKQLAFDLLMTVAKEDEYIVWQIMDNMIIDIIRRDD